MVAPSSHIHPPSRIRDTLPVKPKPVEPTISMTTLTIDRRELARGSGGRREIKMIISVTISIDRTDVAHSKKHPIVIVAVTGRMAIMRTLLTRKGTGIDQRITVLEG